MDTARGRSRPRHRSRRSGALTRHPLLITGNGLLGSKLVEACLKEDEAWPVLISRRSGPRDVPGGTELHQVDVTDETAVSDLFERVRPRWVIHTAAMTDVDGCERDP